MVGSQAAQRPFTMQRIVVTGGTGFIGRHLVDRLAAENATVQSLSQSSGFDILIDELPLANVDHVYHLAGQTFVPRAWSDPVSFHHVNAHGTFRLLDQCRRANVPMTYVSAYVYGAPTEMPISERMPARPNNPYAFSKRAGELACEFFADVYGTRIGVIRPFNVYGPGQDASFLIPEIGRQVLDPDIAEIVVANLKPRRDFVYISDVVDALLRAPGLPSGQPFNVGSGTSVSVADVIKTSMQCAGVAKPYRDRGEVRSNEILDVVADISAIERAVGWRPKVSFEQGISAIIESLRA